MEKLLCGVDLGGTKLAAALFSQEGSLVASEIVYDHHKSTSDEILLAVVDLLNTLLRNNSCTPGDLLGIGVALAGHVNFKEGKIITTSNFPITIRDFPLVDKLKSHFPGLKIVMDNDANAQAYGEFKYGAARGYNSSVFVTVSTGIGGGIILDGKMVRGRSGTAGEVGHSIIDYNSDIKCTCGNYGCSMALASGLFFPSLYRMHLRKGMKSTIGVTEESAAGMDGKKIEDGMKAGDPICRKIVEDSATAVGVSLFNIHQMLNPELVVLGGGLMAFGEEYFQSIRREFLSHTHEMMIQEMEIKLAETGANAGLLGAAALLLE